MAGAPAPRARFRAVALHLYTHDALLPTELAEVQAALENDGDTGLLGAWHGSPEELARLVRPDSLLLTHLAAVRERDAGETARWGGLPGAYDRATGTAHLLVQLPDDVAYATHDVARALLLVLDGRAQEAADTLLPHERLDAILLGHYYGLRL